MTPEILEGESNLSSFISNRYSAVAIYYERLGHLKEYPFSSKITISSDPDPLE